jgi:AhpD family alkylhydroperoxidase
MAHRTYKEFVEEREALNELVLDKANLEIKRFFSLDSQSYRPGALDAKTKEMLGLVASLVLRCDDCIAYHVIRCFELEATPEQITEIFDVGLIVGGSIVIPHLRRARALLDELIAAAG